jgi:hypothetical protein
MASAEPACFNQHMLECEPGTLSRCCSRKRPSVSMRIAQAKLRNTVITQPTMRGGRSRPHAICSSCQTEPLSRNIFWVRLLSQRTYPGGLRRATVSPISASKKPSQTGAPTLRGLLNATQLAPEPGQRRPTTEPLSRIRDCAQTIRGGLNACNFRR